MNRKQILEAASAAIMGEREDNYGGPEDSFAIIGDMWTLYLQHKAMRSPEGTLQLITPHDVAIMMMLLKTARLVHSPDHLDSWIDAAGYAACGGEIATKEG